jgi:hypothetical protein
MLNLGKLNNMNHWRELMPSPYLGAWDVPTGGSLIGKIKSVSKKKISELQGVEKIVIDFSDLPKPLMANSTNMKAIASAVGTPDFTKWVGKEIELITAKVRSVQDGDMVDAIRVKRDKPAPRKTPISDKDFPKAIKAVQDGTWTKEQILSTRILTDEQIKQLDEVQSK